MSKYKKIMLMVLKGGMTQATVAAALHVSKRDVSACAKVTREEGLTPEQVEQMSEAEVRDRWFPRAPRKADDAYLQPDVGAYVERKRRSRKLPRMLMWDEYRRLAEAEGKLAYSYQRFCELFAEEAERVGATRHFSHTPGEKAYIDWAGDVAHVRDRETGRLRKVYVIVVELPFSNRFWAEGFLDMKQDSWQAGQAHAFEDFGGVPGLLVPDNAPTATNRSAPVGVTLLNEEYERFAEHYGTAVLPARVRKPRDKSTSESTVNLVEQWVIAPSEEMTFYTIEEFNEFCAERVRWLNARQFSAKEGSRDSVYEEREFEHMLPLPAERYERCQWATPKVAPDYHVQVDYMRYSVPHALVGETVDARVTATKVSIFHGGEVVAEHTRLRGRKGQFSTDESHMPPEHQALDDPWSRERFQSWANRVGPECGEAIGRLMSRHQIVQQSFVACRNILGLSKSYGRDLLEEACALLNEVGGYPTYTGLKKKIQAIKRARSADEASTLQPAGESLVDRAGSAGRTRGASEWRRDRAKGGE